MRHLRKTWWDAVNAQVKKERIEKKNQDAYQDLHEI